MKKFLFLSILVGLTFTGCTNDDLLGGEQKNGGNKDAIGFMYQTKNMTRAEKLQNTHYEFGVFADNGETVMDNYLVGWGDKSSPYKELVAGATTYGDPTSQVDGLSYWFYEKLNSSNHTDYTTPEQDQILKFWDKSKAAYEFWAYAPYTLKLGSTTTKNAKNVTFQKGADELLFTKLSSFYTNPVTDCQIATADVDAAKAAAAEKYNAEMINYNEGLYAYTTKGKTAYGTDVPFTFNHINAKINLKFYSEIEGYTVQLMDMVPKAIAQTAVNKYAVSKQEGIVLTPATPEQAIYYDQTAKEYKQQAAQAELAKYYAEAQVDVKNVKNNASANMVVGTKTDAQVNNNLYFQIPETAIGTTKADATASATTLYVLPNYDGTNYITTDSAETASTVVENTGYTLHVSYKLIPEDHSANIEMYDARVYIAPEYCKWQAGKAYTYIFKITKNANATTDPGNEDDKYTTSDGTSGTITDEAFVDPNDPRVPDEGGLLPIVFDGIMVSDYETGETGQTGDEWIITESDLATAFQKALASIKTVFSHGGGASVSITSGDGKTTDSKFLVEYSVFADDFKTPNGWPTVAQAADKDPNDNNVFKDLQALSQAMYNQSGIAKIDFNSTSFHKNTSGTLNPPSWYDPTNAYSLESAIATVAFPVVSEGEPLVPVKDKSTTVDLVLYDQKENKSYVQLKVTVATEPTPDPTPAP